MGRYASHGQEVLKRDGKLVGFNAGYGFYAEHESKYNGQEQMKTKKLVDKNKNHPFNGEIVENPEAVHMMEFSDGNVWLTNNSWYYASLMQKTEEERQKIMKQYTHTDDRKRTEDFLSKLGVNNDSPEVVALWNAGFMSSGGDFDLISTSKQSSELLRTLYSEMQKSNVAISSDYSFMFKDRGLSFVLLDQLTQEDLMKKQLVDHRDELAQKFEREYNEYLKNEGLEGLFGGSKYPIEFWNVQITGLLQDDKGEIMPEFYLELTDTSKGREDLDANTMHNLPSRMTGADIKFLVPIVQTPEYAEFAKNHSKEEIGEFLNGKLEEYHEQQRIAEEQGYQIEEDSVNAIATEQRTETIEKTSTSIKSSMENWLHPDKEKVADKAEEIGE